MKQQNKTKGKVLRKIGMKEYLIPSDWEVVNLSSISTLKGRIGWEGLTRKEYLKEGDYYLVTGTDFKDFNVNWDTCVFVNKERYDQDENIQLKEKDILITKDGSIGKIAFVRDMPGKATLNSGIFVVRPTNEKYTPEYIYRIMQSRFFDLFMNVIAGSTIAHLYQRDFVNFEFPMPPVPEQQAISKILSEVDLKLDNLERERQATERLKRGIMVKLLEKKYPFVVAGDYIDVLTGFAFSSKNFNTEKRGLPLIRIRDLDDKETECYYDGEYSNEYLVKKGDILVGMDGEFNTYLWTGESALLNQRVCKLTPKDEKVLNKNFLYYSIQKPIKIIESKIGQTTVKHLSNKDFFKIEIPLPLLPEQEKIVSILSTIDKKLELEQKRKDKLERVRKGLMNDLLTGNKRVNVENVLKIGGVK